MKNRLFEYLDANVGALAWFCVPGGLMSGTIEAYDLETGDFGLNDASYFSGSVSVDLGNAFVLAIQVSAWGDGIPVFLDKNA
jgi:hypothetical protein